MSGYIYLQGSEEVQRAASQMQNAAHEMNRAISNLDDVLFRFLQGFEEKIQRLKALEDKS